MIKTTQSARSDIYRGIKEILSKGLRSAVPKKVLEKEGLDISKLRKDFYVEQGPFELVHFLGIRKSRS